MGREFELKYRATPAQLQAVQEKYRDFTPIQMAAAYYDTPDGDLSRRKWMLRIRRENDTAICTCKTPLPDGSRGEWETPCASAAEAIPVLCELGAPRELASFAPLAPVCAASYTRLAALLTLPECTVELALDQGELTGGGKRLPLCELEVELKSGDEAAARSFAQSLASEFSLAVETRSKSQRAFSLLEEGDRP